MLVLLLILGSGQNPRTFDFILIQEAQQPADLINGLARGREQADHLLVAAESEPGLKCDGGDSAFQELGFQCTQGCLCGEHVVEHHLVVYESEGELPRFLEQIVQEQKTLLNRTLHALMLDGKHHGRLERHLQSAGKAQSKRLDLLVVRHCGNPC